MLHHSVVDRDAVDFSLLAAAVFGLMLSTSALFSNSEPLTLELSAPLSDLFAHNHDDAYAVNGALTVTVDGGEARIEGVKVSLRGHTSLREDECAFPKLKVTLPAGADIKAPMFAGLHSIKIGTHCGESTDDQLTRKYGRLANEHSPVREAFVYRLLAALDVPTLMVRRAKITYRDSAGDEGLAPRAPLVREALIVEDSDDAVKRVGGRREIGETEFTNARTQLAPANTARLAFAEAMLGNFDWCLKMTADDRYRCDARHPLWNILAADRGNDRVVPLIYDFDVAGIVVGRHSWFPDVFPRTFAEAASEAEVEVVAQLQRTRSLFTRRELDDARAAFVARKPQAFESIQAAGIDGPGEAIARQYLNAFYKQIESDQLFYRPVVRTPQAQAFATSDGQPACGRRSVIPVGTPVSEPLQRTGDRVQVLLLDALWQWSGEGGCDAIRRGPVWVDANAIGADFPVR